VGFIQADQLTSCEQGPPLPRIEEHKDRSALHLLPCNAPNLTLDFGGKILKLSGSMTWKIVFSSLVQNSALHQVIAIFFRRNRRLWVIAMATPCPVPSEGEPAFWASGHSLTSAGELVLRARRAL
jgi:hypothetical protein